METKRVRCANDNLIFNSVSEAAKYYNVTYSCVYSSIRKFYKCHGRYFHWDLGERLATGFDRKIEREKEVEELRRGLK